jgi:hypothetical protein
MDSLKPVDEDLDEADQEQSQYEKMAQIDYEDDEGLIDQREQEKEEFNDTEEFDRSYQSALQGTEDESLNAINNTYKKPDHHSRDNKFKTNDTRPRVTHADDKPRQKQGCWQILREGKCDANPCRFSHEPEDLKKSYADLLAMIKAGEKKYGAPPERKPGGTSASISD